jgi:hypothetical protein
VKNYYIFLPHGKFKKKSINDEYNMKYYEDGEDTEDNEDSNSYVIK